MILMAKWFHLPDHRAIVANCALMYDVLPEVRVRHFREVFDIPIDPLRVQEKERKKKGNLLVDQLRVFGPERAQHGVAVLPSMIKDVSHQTQKIRVFRYAVSFVYRCELV